ncbi:MAG: hypothetical protein SFV52_05960 [Saprospiraceae bacterium]|nr:hypothetical protein [Saprospiraceae bacterium]
MRYYPGKMLLLGEYVLLLGAPALAVPVPAFCGRWLYDDSLPFGDELLALAQSDGLREIPEIDSESFEQAVRKGLRFQSNIPLGYGLGSSGALIAGVYDRFARQKTDDPTALRTLLGKMESHFHGQSSGLDPLTSYLNTPLLIQQQKVVTANPSDRWSTTPPLVFLLDTGTPRKTAPLVARFLELSTQQNFRHTLETAWMPENNRALDAWMQADNDLFWPAVKRISEIQFSLMRYAIPDNVENIWKKTLTEENFSLKLCGAGGGGFLLGFARTQAAVLELAGTFRIVYPKNEQHVEGE